MANNITDFIIRFLICNIFVSVMVGILLTAKLLFRKNLSPRMQYHLWFLLLGLLAVPFLPIRLIGYAQLFSRLGILKFFSEPDIGTITSETAAAYPTGTADWMNDFTLSVSKETPSIVGTVLFGIWTVGIVVMIILAVKSKFQLASLKKSALPLQNKEVQMLYLSCLAEMNISKKIPVCSTAFLKSPIIMGFLKPCIYLPIHLISDSQATDMRYMILHELQHYKHKDNLVNNLMNIAGILYWFNPFVWYALKEMRNDREVACDTSVLDMLPEEDYAEYGNTLINFAEKISRSPFPFAAGISGTMRQMKKRILNIASYEKQSSRKRAKGMTAFVLVAVLLTGLAPALSTYAADENRYQWDTSSGNISYVDLSAYFGEYEGSFVLFDSEDDVWNIYDITHAARRVAPDSTYKIYDALFGLEEGVITPEDSLIAWNKEIYPIDTWNADQNLQTAMKFSVNWYFQTIDRELGTYVVNECIQEIGYGNENVSGDFPSYWLKSSLKISPIEQVELLTRLYNNDFEFASENINAVKDSIRLSSSETGTLYGKTGTGNVDGQNVNGWFIGYVENSGHTCFFATNISSVSGAAGSDASKITLSILSDMNIWK